MRRPVAVTPLSIPTSGQPLVGVPGAQLQALKPDLIATLNG